MIKLLRDNGFANKFKDEVYPFKYSMRYIDAGRNSVIQLKYTIDEPGTRLVAIAECSYKNDKLLKLIIRSVEPEIVKLFIDLYSVRDYSYTFAYNRYAYDSYYTDIVKAYNCDNHDMYTPKNTGSIKLLRDNIFFVKGKDNCQSISNIQYHIIFVSSFYGEYWEDKMDFLLNLAGMVIIKNEIYIRGVLKNTSGNYVYDVALFLESLNRKSMKSARKI